MDFEWRGIIFDDVVLGENTASKLNLAADSDYNDWACVCAECAKKYNIPESVLDSAGQGVCGVKGCNNETDMLADGIQTYYIDFPEDELIAIELMPI